MPLNPQAAQDTLLALSKALNTIQDYPLGADAPLSGLQETLRAGVIQPHAQILLVRLHHANN
jgi:hypothetical protein